MPAITARQFLIVIAILLTLGNALALAIPLWIPIMFLAVAVLS